MATEFHTGHVTMGHMTGPHQTRAKAEQEAVRLRKDCPCKGDPECADDETFPHGINTYKVTDGYHDNSPDY